jgi:hypothetical protein
MYLLQKSAGLRRVLNELCGSPLGLNCPALTNGSGQRSSSFTQCTVRASREIGRKFNIYARREDKCHTESKPYINSGREIFMMLM